MNEDQACCLIEEWFGAEAINRLQTIVKAVAEETSIQNLVSPASLNTIWCRHVLDSAQLVRLSDRSGLWLDIGTGGGFPGLVVAALTDRPMILCEPRVLRADFLRRVVRQLDRSLSVSVEQRRCESLSVSADTISARAVGSVSKLLDIASACSNSQTEWLFPRGMNGKNELDALPPDRQRMFHVERSQSQPDAVILVGRGAIR